MLTITCLVVIAANGQMRSFKSGGLYGFKNEQNKEVIPPSFDYAFDFSGKLAIVKKGDYWGYVNSQGKAICPFEFDKCGDFENGLAFVIKDGKTGVINDTGKMVIDFAYSQILELSEGFYKCESQGKWAIHGEDGLITKFKYDDVFKRRYGFFTYKIDSTYGLLSSTGKEIGQPIFSEKIYVGQRTTYNDTSLYFSAAVGQNRRDSYMNINGEVYLDGSLWKTEYNSPDHYKICTGVGEKEDLVKMVRLKDGKAVFPESKMELDDRNWRPCDGFGYDSPPFAWFKNETGGKLVFLGETNIITNMFQGEPWVSESLVFVPVDEDESIYDVRDWNGKMLVAGANIVCDKGIHDCKQNQICEDHGFRIGKDEKFGVWDETLKTFEFPKAGKLKGKKLFCGNTELFNGATEYKVIKKTEGISVYSFVSQKRIQFFVYQASYGLFLIGSFDADAKVKMKFIEYLKDDNSIYYGYKVDGELVEGDFGL
ncbi:MAG: hypothetical protein ACI9J3_002091 [Parvicellaceae bacterium]|jgi:hypothetical protein